MYVCQLSLLQLQGQFTYIVCDMLLIMYCMCLPAFFVAGADKSQLWVYTYVYLLMIYCLRLFVVVRNM